MEQYLDLVRRILLDGKPKENRTGIAALTIAGATFEHNMSDGFPLLTTKKIPFRLPASELEFFIQGYTDKQWLQERNNHIWDQWCNPENVKHVPEQEKKERQKQERDLGPIYGFQWRHFGAEYRGYEHDYIGQGIDQLAGVVQKLKEDTNDRRMLVSAWNPAQLHQMALPPCHWGYHLTIIDGKLNLTWNQRSVDTMLGLPYNIASYGLLLHLLAKESSLQEGKLVGFLSDVHIYGNHIGGAKEQLSRAPYSPPTVQTENFISLLEWEHTHTKLLGYQKHPPIKFEVAV